MADETLIPGSPVSHSIITPDCRANRGAKGAWREAVARAERQYEAILTGWAEAGVPEMHLVLTYVRPERPALNAPSSPEARP